MSNGALRLGLALAVITLSALLVSHAVRRLSARQQQQRAAMSAVAGGDTGVIIAFCTVPSKEVAHKIAASLVESKLAACVNIIPGLESVYSWEGRVQTDPELLLKIKTRAALLPQLSAVVQGLHPYDTPELLAVQAAGGSEKYLNWVLDSTQAG